MYEIVCECVSGGAVGMYYYFEKRFIESMY